MPSDENIIKLSQEEAARTAYNTFEHACGRNPQDWDGLSLEKQAAFLRLAMKAEATLERNQGQKWPEIAVAVRRAALGEDSGEPTDLIAWEAVARHLSAIIDEYDIPDLAAMESSWRAWAKSRLEKQHV